MSRYLSLGAAGEVRRNPDKVCPPRRCRQKGSAAFDWSAPPPLPEGPEGQSVLFSDHSTKLIWPAVPSKGGVNAAYYLDGLLCTFRPWTLCRTGRKESSLRFTCWKLPSCDAGDDGARICDDDLKFVPAISDHEERMHR